jgi:hypothetical protein
LSRDTPSENNYDIEDAGRFIGAIKNGISKNGTMKMPSIL